MADPEVRISLGEETGDLELQGQSGEVETGAEGGLGEVAGEETVPPRATFVEYAPHLQLHCSFFSLPEISIDALPSQLSEISHHRDCRWHRLRPNRSHRPRSASRSLAILRFGHCRFNSVSPDPYVSFPKMCLISPTQNRRIELFDDDLDAVSCFLEYLYTGEYFPHKTSAGTLETDPTAPAIDDTGVYLLKHAKVYTLAEKLGVSVSEISLFVSTKSV